MIWLMLLSTALQLAACVFCIYGHERYRYMRPFFGPMGVACALILARRLTAIFLYANVSVGLDLLLFDRLIIPMCVTVFVLYALFNLCAFLRLKHRGQPNADRPTGLGAGQQWLDSSRTTRHVPAG